MPHGVQVLFAPPTFISIATPRRLISPGHQTFNLDNAGATPVEVANFFRTASFVVKQLAFNQLSTGQNRGGSPNFFQGSEARGYFTFNETITQSRFSPWEIQSKTHHPLMVLRFLVSKCQRMHVSLSN